MYTMNSIKPRCQYNPSRYKAIRLKKLKKNLEEKHLNLQKISCHVRGWGNYKESFLSGGYDVKRI